VIFKSSKSLKSEIRKRIS